MTAFFSTLSRLISAASSALRRSSKSGTVSARSRLSFSYISSVAVSVIISSSHEFQTHIKCGCRMCQSSDGNIVDAGGGNFENIFECYVARSFQFCLAVTDRNRLTHHFIRHVIEQNSFHSECERFSHIVERAGLNFNLELRSGRSDTF